MKPIQHLYCSWDGTGHWKHSDTATISKLTVDLFIEMLFKDGGIQVSFVIAKEKKRKEKKRKEKKRKEEQSLHSNEYSDQSCLGHSLWLVRRKRLRDVHMKAHKHTRVHTHTFPKLLKQC